MVKPLRAKDVFWRLLVPPDATAMLDWASGLTVLDASASEAKRIFVADDANRSARDEEIGAALTHETMHFLQIATTGYLYSWAMQLYALVLRAIKQAVGSFDTMEDVRELISQADTRFSVESRQSVREHIARLDKPGACGATTRCLFEAHALHAEYRVHWRPADAQGYFTFLEQRNLPTEYRLAYDLARLRLGDPTAFTVLSPLATFSLCTSDPPEAFDRLLSAVADRPALANLTEPDPETWTTTVNEILADILVGTAMEVYGAASVDHPVYSKAVLALNAAAAEAFSVVAFFLDPVRYLDAIIESAVQPILLQPEQTGALALWTPSAKSTQARSSDEILILLTLAATAQRLSESDAVDAGGESASALARLAWTAFVKPALLELSVPAEGLRTTDIKPLIRRFDPEISESSSSELLSVWGRCAVEFPCAEGQGADPRDERIRRFVAAVHERLPAFPAYLAFLPRSFMFWSWFGSLADPKAWRSNSAFDILDASVVDCVVETVAAIAEWGRMLEIDPRPQLVSLLAAYPEELSQQLIREATIPTAN